MWLEGTESERHEVGSNFKFGESEMGSPSQPVSRSEVDDIGLGDFYGKHME